MFTKACEYGIRAIVFIAQKSLKGEIANQKMISEAIESPAAFTAKILQTLVRHGIIESVFGKAGGFKCHPDRYKEITLHQLVMALDPGFNRDSCVLGLHKCSEVNPCPAHHGYKTIKYELQHSLLCITLHDMVEHMDSSKTVLKDKPVMREKV
ncbi:MAG: Rrf2 family transcriptional regulator [Chitinophagaceae bacterium]|nr:Rrf2 family transcriptional regulator [Chitinophagaceae bacterium]